VREKGRNRLVDARLVAALHMIEPRAGPSTAIRRRRLTADGVARLIAARSFDNITYDTFL
jgi:hypothetical protein